MPQKKTDNARSERILVLNPGSTSTKLAIFDGSECSFAGDVQHTPLDLSRFDRIWDQYEYRKSMILEFLEDRNVALSSLDAVVGRGGLFAPTVSGTYGVNQRMIVDARDAVRGEHASNLGAVLAFGIAWDHHIPSFIVDPPCVDELDATARYSGMPEIPRTSLVHALNVKATARMVADELGKDHAEVNLVVAHLGGGISVCALRKGCMADVSNALSAGPFAPERAGNVQTVDLVKMCFSGEFTAAEIQKKLVGGGGMMAYLGTTDAVEVTARMDRGDKEARLVMDAMIHQIAKEIGGMAAALDGELAAIVLTGGLANNEYIVEKLRTKIAFLGKVIVVPGEDELKALALGCLRVLRGEEVAKTYPQTVEGESASRT
ncbi:MAG: butyrate kinase [Candidatus Eisenbacteria bacterium]